MGCEDEMGRGQNVATLIKGGKKNEEEKRIYALDYNPYA
jgi:hypothetical protein